MWSVKMLHLHKWTKINRINLRTSTGKHHNSSDSCSVNSAPRGLVSKHSVKNTRLNQSILFWQTFLSYCKHSKLLKCKNNRVQSADFPFRWQIMLNEVWKCGEAVTSIRTPICSSYRDSKQSLELHCFHRNVLAQQQEQIYTTIMIKTHR